MRQPKPRSQRWKRPEKHIVSRDDFKLGGGFNYFYVQPNLGKILIFFGLKPPTSQQFSYHLHIGLLKMIWKNWAVILGVNERTYSVVCV